MREVALVKLCYTRWSCRHTSIKAVKNRLTAIIATLEDISEDSGSRAIESRGLLYQIKSFPFFLSLIIFDKIFSITGNLSNLLQAEELNYAGAAACIKATKTTLTNLRSDSEWDEIWSVAVELAEEHTVEVSPLRQRRRRRIPTHLSDSIVDAPTGVSTTLS